MDKAETDKLFPGITGTLNQDMADVEALGIRQTPTFFLNGKRLENFNNRFPDAIELMVRGLRSGLPNVPGLTGLSGKPTLPGLGGFPGKKK